MIMQRAECKYKTRPKPTKHEARGPMEDESQTELVLLIFINRETIRCSQA